MTEQAPRRYLIATAVSHYTKAAAHLEWDRPGLADARRQVVELFTTRLGYEHVSDLGLNPTREQLTAELRNFCKSADRRPDDILAVYIAGHGEVLDDGEHVLLTSDTDPDDIEDALPTLTLARKILRGTQVRRLMLMLDTCFSGQGGNELLASMARLKGQWGQDSGAGLAIVTSAQPNELAETGAFPHLLSQAVSSLATAGYAPETLALDAVVSAMRNHPKRPGHQTIGLEIIGLTGTTPPFLPNHRHSAQMTQIDLALQQTAEWEEQAERREVEYRTRLLRRAMGHSDPARVGWWFSGRHRALRDITRWLTNLPPEQPALAVTAGPGSGKTAILGLLATVTDGERLRTVPLHSLGLSRDQLPAVGTLNAAVYAQNLTDQQVLQGITAAARMRADTVADFLNQLAAQHAPSARPLTLLIDALDEAATMAVARRVADAAGRSFLVARIAAGTLAATPPPADPNDPAWRQSLPRLPGDAIRNDLTQRFGEDAARVMDLLRPLAFAEGQGLPWEDIWAPVASAIAGHTYTNDDLRQLRSTAGSYVVEALEDGRSVYRLYHEAMAEHLRSGQDAQCVHTAITTGLRRLVPYGIDATPDWSRAHPYIRRHLATHASQAGVLDDLVSDPEYLVYAECDELAPQLGTLTTNDGRLHAAIYRSSIGAHRPLTPDQRREILALEAARYGAHTTRRALTRSMPPTAWKPLYATGSDISSALQNVMTGHSDRVAAVACTHLHGRPVAVSGSYDSTVRVWDLESDRAIGEPLTGHTNSVSAVACTHLHGRPVAVSGAWDDTVRVWDLESGRVIGEPLTGHTDAVRAVACTHVEGRPVAVTGSEDRTVRVWDLESGRLIGEPLTGHGRSVVAVACTEVDGRPVAVTGSEDRTVRVWDLESGRLIGEPLTGQTDAVFAVACTHLDGKPVAITGAWDETVRVWDPESGRVIGKLFTGRGGAVNAVAVLHVDGRPLAVTGSHDRTVRVWDLESGRLIGEPLTGHAEGVNAVACTEVDGRPVAVTGSHDRTVRVWDLESDRATGDPLTGHSGVVNAVACTEVDGRPVAVTGSYDRTVRVWDLESGRMLGEPLTGQVVAVNAVACTHVDGRPVAVTTSLEGVRVWDLRSGRMLGEPLTSDIGAVNAVACTHLDGRPVAVTGSDDNTVRVWDLRSGRAIGEPLAGHFNAVSAVACLHVDGRPVAVTGSWDRTVRVWDLKSGRAIGEPMHVDGQPWDHMRVWDLKSDWAIGRRLTDHFNAVSAVACLHVDGRPVAVTGAWDGTVRVWDLESGRMLGEPLIGHLDRVNAVACTHLNGLPVAFSGSRDGTVRIWDLNQRTSSAFYTGAACRAIAAAEGFLVYGFGRDLAVFARNTEE
ncbi:caspase family protein [Streptomyces sp. NPDC023998]|uniref:caspase family protein n=1 Tax=Streptomyces sp. NPDC023998 TaxID=3154597 RepID=UPI0034069FA8